MADAKGAVATGKDVPDVVSTDSDGAVGSVGGSSVAEHVGEGATGEGEGEVCSASNTAVVGKRSLSTGVGVRSTPHAPRNPVITMRNMDSRHCLTWAPRPLRTPGIRIITSHSIQILFLRYQWQVTAERHGPLDDRRVVAIISCSGGRDGGGVRKLIAQR